ncbi:50S ribosomal protein L25/general stress protein Ctc [Oxalobacter vibrioformis]|uniref:Large ribosomal subunit protein bL25 n=1 Tax=Oxalobacter vibrioformis TaxID=933080 RepID=A0A9E9LYB2_9BURK|nr:50S ribosomal protein L25/general stress protein Ctc [Oxalobacter vibrioformis]WAW09128.1 50S ribosomal protein L25/general stress protein Ctc [Oxalobacter vibrioformis]
MKVVAFPRAEQGTGASRRLRTAGMTPGIIYGGTSEPMAIKLDHNALYHALRREAFHSSILDMEIEGKIEKVLLRDYQMHAYKQIVMHIDFQRVSADQPIHVKVPLHFLNEETAVAVKQSNGIIHRAVSELDITCLPGDLPNFIEVDLANLDIGQTIHLSDVKLPKGVSATSSDADMTIATASVPSAAPADDADATSSEEPKAGE